MSAKILNPHGLNVEPDASDDIRNSSGTPSPSVPDTDTRRRLLRLVPANDTPNLDDKSSEIERTLDRFRDTPARPAILTASYDRRAKITIDETPESTDGLVDIGEFGLKGKNYYYEQMCPSDKDETSRKYAQRVGFNLMEDFIESYERKMAEKGAKPEDKDMEIDMADFIKSYEEKIIAKGGNLKDRNSRACDPNRYSSKTLGCYTRMYIIRRT